MATVETKWSLTVDTQKCTARFVVEYHSTLPPERHEEIHKQILKQADVMIRRMWGSRPEWQRYDVEVETVRVDPNDDSNKKPPQRNSQKERV